MTVAGVLGGARNGHVHHIVPYSWASRRLGWTAEQINAPHNLLCLCRQCHFSKIHGTDMRDIFQKYQDDKEAFARMFERRRRLTDEGVPYWETKWDVVMQRIAASRTDRVIEAVPWPIRKSRIRRLSGD